MSLTNFPVWDEFIFSSVEIADIYLFHISHRFHLKHWMSRSKQQFGVDDSQTFRSQLQSQVHFIKLASSCRSLFDENCKSDLFVPEMLEFAWYTGRSYSVNRRYLV